MKFNRFCVPLLIVMLILTTIDVSSARAGRPNYDKLLHLGKKKSVTLKSQIKLPSSAITLASSITVSANGKVLAKNVRSFNAGRGLFSVRSKVTYRPRVVKTTYYTSTQWFKCRITDIYLTSDRTTFTDNTYIEDYVSGQVTFEYTGDCSSDGWNSSLNDGASWTATWEEDEYVMADVTDPDDTETAILNEANHRVGDKAWTDGEVNLERTIGVRGKPVTKYLTTQIYITT